MFDNILIVYSEKLTEKHLGVVENIEKIVKRELAERCKTVKVKDLQSSFFDGVDLIVTVGGDGTFIRASHFIKDKLILGVNSEPEYSEGALTSINENELDVLREMLREKYSIIKRQRARISRNDVTLDKLALNEVYIGAKSQFHTSKYIIDFKRNKEEQRSSGVLVATGSGSRAWYKSAGGKPFSYSEKKLAFIIREPYSGKIFRPKILKGELSQGEKIIIESRMRDGGAISIDSNSICDFNYGDMAEIELSDEPLGVIAK